MTEMIVEKLLQKVRLDKYLLSKFPQLTRNHLQKLIKKRAVLVNQKEVKAHHLVKANDLLSLNLPKPQKIDIKAENIPLDIIYEDKNILIINKPAGLVVHPAGGGVHRSGTIVNAILYYCHDLSGINDKLRPGIVHRLDKDTSGLMIITKNDQANHYISQQIEQKTIKKIYLALIKGHLSPKTGSIEAPIMRSFKDYKKMIISNHKNAKFALTHYKVIRKFTNYSLIEAQIVTGRTHQIRVHFQAIGHPVIGDQTYGDPQINQKFKNYGLQRQFLHAHLLGFKMPHTKKWREFKSPLPKELSAVLDQLK